jgi:hypothetical protein
MPGDECDKGKEFGSRKIRAREKLEEACPSDTSAKASAPWTTMAGGHSIFSVSNQAAYGRQNACISSSVTFPSLFASMALKIRLWIAVTSSNVRALSPSVSAIANMNLIMVAPMPIVGMPPVMPGRSIMHRTPLDIISDPPDIVPSLGSIMLPIPEREFPGEGYVGRWLFISSDCAKATAALPTATKEARRTAFRICIILISLSLSATYIRTHLQELISKLVCFEQAGPPNRTMKGIA